MKTLPENINLLDDNGEVMARPRADVVKQAIKSLNIKDLDTEDAKMPAKEIFEKILLMNFRTKAGESYELPDEFQDYSNANEYASNIVAAHREAEEKIKGEKDAEKQQKQQEAQAKKEMKEKEDAEFKDAGQKFEQMFLRKASKLKEAQVEKVNAMLLTVKKSLPKAAAMSENGMGIALSDGATKEDVASAIATVVDGLESVAGMKGALQFIAGDLINQAYEKRAYRTKGDACSAIKFIVKDKLGKKFDIGTLNAYALAAERVPVEKRKQEVNFSMYLAASKVTPPRDKNAKPSDAIALAGEVETFRNNIIDKINNGEINGQKDLDGQINKFKEEKGFAKQKTASAVDLGKRLFFALWIKANLLGDKDSVDVQIDVKNTKTYTRQELTDIEQDSLNQLQNLLIKQNVPNLIKGVIEKKETVEGKDGKKEKKTTEIPYLLNNPFDVETDEEPNPDQSQPNETEDQDEDSNSGEE